MKIPIVAIIGLPNAGKSTLFNKVLERRKALTHPEAGTTRDRHYGLASWNGLSFYLVDTAGITLRPNSSLEKSIQKQTAIAREEADLILFVVDGKSEVGSQDFDVAKKLRHTGKPVVLAANKFDTRNAKAETQAAPYQKLGLGQPYMVSATNGVGLGDLLDKITEELKKSFNGETKDESDRLRLAFIGKPNVGKSSLINALLKQDRLIVDEKAGTTRSTVEIPFEFDKQKYLLLDTAGLKKKWKSDIDVEAAAAMQSLRTIPQVDVALFVLDANETATFQDQAIAQEILEQTKSIIIVLNKTDLLTNEQKERVLDRLPDYLPQLWWAPVVFTSAAKQRGLDKMLDMAKIAFESATKQIDNVELDKFLEKMLEEHMPGKMDDQRAPKIYNLKQISINPPTFKIAVNFPAAIATAWRRYFEKQFRLKFGFEGTPVIFKYIKHT